MRSRPTLEVPATATTTATAPDAAVSQRARRPLASSASPARSAPSSQAVRAKPMLGSSAHAAISDPATAPTVLIA